MSSTIEELKDSAKFHKYFWNGLFAALYEDIRKDVSIFDLSNGHNNGFHIFASETTIKNYLSCKTEMDFERFLEFCHGIQVDIEKKRFLELLPYVNRAFAYLDEQDRSRKASRGKNLRRKVFSQADHLRDDDYLWEQELAMDEEAKAGKAEILATLNGLSQKEFSLLYRVADGYPSTCECDDTFMDCYGLLNEKGQAVFQEALESEHKKWYGYHDRFCDFCEEMAAEDIPIIQDITPEVLYDKLDRADFCFSPEYVESLKKYRSAEPRTWKTLALYHEIIFSYPEGNIEGMTFSETQSLLIFLYWLTSIPSLCK